MLSQGALKSDKSHFLVELVEISNQDKWSMICDMWLSARHVTNNTIHQVKKIFHDRDAVRKTDMIEQRSRAEKMIGNLIHFLIKTLRSFSADGSESMLCNSF